MRDTTSQIGGLHVQPMTIVLRLPDKVIDRIDQTNGTVHPVALGFFCFDETLLPFDLYNDAQYLARRGTDEVIRDSPLSFLSSASSIWWDERRALAALRAGEGKLR
jgi:hypothetical protein